ncbi:MAG: hypothetical protein C0425_08300 [Chlorobiaceae bacterium]|nr:hypothetical protein [Chlorobiaceae bacterium]MBA4310322.1 hypothetical protein [Chlorobiaceae bacterium]
MDDVKKKEKTDLDNFDPIDGDNENEESNDWELIYSCSEFYEAQMIKANLEGAGIETLILSQKDSSYPVVGSLSVIKIFVKKKDVPSANEFINSLTNNNFVDEESD